MNQANGAWLLPQEVRSLLRLMCQLDKGDRYSRNPVEAYGSLDCPFCNGYRSALVFDGGYCYCENCPLGWESHSMLAIAGYYGLSYGFVETSADPAPMVQYRDPAEVRANDVFAFCAYGSGPGQYGRKRTGRRAVLLG